MKKVKTEDLNGWARLRGGEKGPWCGEQGAWGQGSQGLEPCLRASEFLGAVVTRRVRSTDAPGPVKGALRWPVRLHCTASPGQQAGLTASRHTCISARGLLFFSLLGDANRQISEYKFKLSKAEQDITTLEQSVSPSCVWCQVISGPLTTHLLPASQWLTP